MAAVKSYKCDLCGVERGPSNHWVLGYHQEDGALAFEKWDQALAENTARQPIHLCGEGCATKVLSRQIQVWRAGRKL